MASSLANDAGSSDVATLCAALLHDVLETASVGAQFIESVFGGETRNILEDVSRLNDQMRVRTNAEAIAANIPLCDEAKLVTLAHLYITLGELQTEPPSEWSLAQIQAEMHHAKKRVDQLRGVQPILESAFDKLYFQVPLKDVKNPSRYHWHSPEFVQ